MSEFVLIGTLNRRDLKRGASIAANNFHWNAIDLLQIKRIISINSQEEFNNDRLEIGFLYTTHKMKYLWKSIMLLSRMYRGHVPIFYNIEWYTIHLLLWSILMRKRPRVIALDLSINSILYKILLYLSHRPIILRSKFLLSNAQDHVLFPGFLSEDLVRGSSNSLKESRTRCLLCGSLGPNTGLENFCELASIYNEMEFHIAGIPHRIQESEIYKVIDKYNVNSNIVYHGVLSRKDYRNLLHMCNLGFSLRAENKENKYNFPSKILDYISAGLIPISSIDYNEFANLRIYSPELLSRYNFLEIQERETIIFGNTSALKEYNKYERFL